LIPTLEDALDFQLFALDNKLATTMLIAPMVTSVQVDLTVELVDIVSFFACKLLELTSFIL